MNQINLRFATSSPAGSDPLQAIETAYRRIETERDRNCWIHVRPIAETRDHCRTLMRRADSGETLPLLGVLFGVKDNIDVAGMPTTAAVPAFSYMPARSAESVERLIAAGAICIGKTNLDQLATGLSGARSPYGSCSAVADPRYVSGGSSSGSAVAVAAGHVTFALGTDTGGSGRIPAGFNDIVGIKPTVGLVSSRGLVPNCPTLDCVSIFCNSVQEGAAILDVMEGFDPEDPYSRPAPASVSARASGKFRFGRLMAKDLEFFGMPECGALYEQACERFSALGGTAVEIDFAPFAEAGEMMFTGPWVAERRASISSLMEVDTDRLLDVTKAVLRTATSYSAVDTFTAMHRLLRLRRRSQDLLAGIDALVVPTAPRPFLLDEMHSDPITLNNRLGHYSYFANLLDLCAVAIPNGVLPNGIPMGVTLLARAWSDRALIALARRLDTKSRKQPHAK
ncbi:allophanate hydrolase [Bradyrhizobium sp. JYMT SZCCT0428]|uniref:allophanate hydrolase n=1 Tax=Bradyrhizobium sp. JYMT SZCCT0428 TaxID=2807673 RepID=UPI001BA7FF69|nr:allophanate hydrolase [Bradyrhizobium sp. JYMT SZCCT0428]MBR1152407.1 allophanate hydrolase [Bradyrhizobium sp. JYMT SZCCT0428]